MNLARHAAVLWRFRRVTAAGVVLGIALAIFAGYHVGSNGLTPRGTETWSAVSSILVTQAGFPEGRVTLPTTQVGEVVTSEGNPAVEDGAPPKNQVEFADPGRLSALGDLYSKFLTSDEVLRRVPERPPLSAVQASPFASSQGGLLLPVIQLTTMGPSAKSAHDTNLHVYEALLGYMDEQADANKIPAGRRVELKVMVAPEATLMSRPKPTASIVIFLLVMLGTIAVTHLLEALRNRKQIEALETMVEWDAPTSGLRSGADADPADLAATGSNGSGAQRPLRA